MTDGSPRYPDDAETVVATLASIYAAQGKAREVALLATSSPAFDWQNEHYWNNQTTTYWRLLLHVPADLYGQLADHRESLEEAIGATAKEISPYDSDAITGVKIVPAPVTNADWRAQALGWLRGEGINNQGRVRSDNIATRTVDGLLFRSQAEICLYHALKALGVSFAPLPVFVRGGPSYRRIEPDFVIVHRGLVVAVEVDGDTVHRETPAEAHDRTTMLQHEGVQIERVRASDCATAEGATACAKRLVALIEKLRSNRA